MVPLFVLLLSFAVLRCAGFLGVTALNNADLPLRGGLFLMFLVAASAHWGRGRADLIRMVPTALPRAGLLVSVTGVLEILGAIGLIFSATARLAAVCLAILLLALFPAKCSRGARKPDDPRPSSARNSLKRCDSSNISFGTNDCRCAASLAICA
jgi:uncharacterized membrane protein